MQLAPTQLIKVPNLPTLAVTNIMHIALLHRAHGTQHCYSVLGECTALRGERKQAE